MIFHQVSIEHLRRHVGPSLAIGHGRGAALHAAAQFQAGAKRSEPLE
jgi:hypothetical protein